MTLDEHYICQRAANAIISEIGPFRVSTDALQAINQFLDEFIVLLLTCSLSLDLSEIKSVVFSLLSSTLGKNAIVEAELEVKTFTETESIDYDLYERMRSLGENDSFPLDEAVPLLREKCFEYCTLADKDDQLYLQKSIRHKRNEANMKVIISPIVAIYVTTVMEHIAEYLLTAVAMTAEHEDTDYVRVKEVFLALIDDIQLGDVFHRMDLREKMEKRAGYMNNNTFNRYRSSYLPPNAPNQTRKSYLPDPQQNNETGSFLDIAFDDLDLDYFDDNNPRKSTISTGSRIPDIARPQSAMSYTSNNTYSNNTSSNNNRKSTFHLFKNNRNSFSGEIPRADSPHGASGAAYDPDASPGTNMNFDDLIKSGGTMKVSLTPNRLRSIEIKDQTKDELSPPPLTWERRSTSSPRLSAVNATRPSSPLVRQNTSSSNRTTGAKKPQSMPRFSSSSTSLPTSNSKHDMLADTSINEKPKKMSIEVPKINARPQTPTSPLSKKSFIVHEANKFENPREAPPPPASTSSPILELPPLTIPIATPVKKATVTTSTPMVKSNSQTKLVSPSTSTPSIAAGTAVATAAVTSSPTKNPPTPPTKLPSAASPKTPTPLSKLPSSPKATFVKSSLPSSIHSSSGSSDSLSSDISSMANMPSPIISTTPSVKSIQEPPLPRPAKTGTTTINTNGMVLRRSSVSSKKSRENLRKLKEEQELQQQQQQQPEQLVDEPMPLSAVAVVEEEKKKFNQDLDKATVEAVPAVVTDEPQQLDQKQEQDTSMTNRQVRFNNSNEDLAKTDSSPTNIKDTNEQPTIVVPRIKKAATLSPERPSSMVAKRASMVGNNRRRSLHESYATEKHQDIILRQRVSNVGSVSVSIKQWDDILKTEEAQQASVIPPASHRRSVLRQLRQQQMEDQQQDDNSSSATSSDDNTNTTTTNNNNNNITNAITSNNSNNNAVLDKVLKFERASSLDNVAHQRVSHMPRRERFLYLQQDPSAIERKSNVLTAGPKKTLPVPVHRAVGIDQGVQTDYPEKEEEPIKSSKQSSTTTNTDDSSDDEEHGLVDGDEEWFLQDDEWDEQEETAIVEWLLGE